MSSEHNVVRIKGSLPGGEVWSVNISYAVHGELDPAPGAIEGFSALNDWAASIGAMNSGTVLSFFLRGLLSTSTKIEMIRCEFWDGDGNMASAGEYSLATPQAGTGTAKLPPQCALVASFRTLRAGRSYKGRIFWPAQGVSLDAATLRVDSGTAASVATATAEFIDEIASVAPGDIGIVPSVYSPTLGTAEPITSVAIGNVIDTQRRRRDGLVENYSVAVTDEGS